MLPKSNKSKEINEIIEIKRTEYIQIDEDVLIEGRPIVAGPVFHTRGISEILHCIMEPALSFFWVNFTPYFLHVLPRMSFNFPVELSHLILCDCHTMLFH